jgi:hypothetical protein
MGNISWIMISLALASVCVALFSGALWLLRQRVSHTSLKKHHDVAGFMLGTIGVLYSVILGFTVINAKDRFTQASNTVHTEAMTLADLYRNGFFFDTSSSQRIRSALRDYLQYVLEEEWSGHTGRLHAEKAIQGLWLAFSDVDLTQEKERLWYAQSISKLDDLMNARLSRQFYFQERLGSMMWSLLIIGAVITISFMFFFGLESFRSQVLMTGLLVGYLSFMLYLVYCLDHPFEGSQGIKPTALEQTFSVFDGLDKK